LLDQVLPLDISILSDSQMLERHISSLGRPAAIWHGSRLMWVDDPSGLLVMWAARARVLACLIAGRGSLLMKRLPDLT
jgi:hypothetical protein